MPLHSAAKYAGLEVIKALLAACPAAAAEKDGNNRLPLHVALANNAPLDVVAALLAANLAAAANKDRHGNTPLHLALKNPTGGGCGTAGCAPCCCGRQGQVWLHALAPCSFN